MNILEGEIYLIRTKERVEEIEIVTRNGNSGFLIRDSSSCRRYIAREQLEKRIVVKTSMDY